MGLFINKKRVKKITKDIATNITCSTTSDKYTWKIPGYEYYHYDEIRKMGYISCCSTTGKLSPTKKSNNIINSTNLTNINMNTTVSNQEQQVESAVKYLTEKREKPSNIIEIDKKEYQKIVEELAELKAKIKTNQEVIRVEETEYDGENIFTYIGKDKAIADLSKEISDKNFEIRDLQTELKIANDEVSKISEETRREKNKFEKLNIERLEDEFEKKNKNLKANHKSEIGKLEKTIDKLNYNIRELNDRNKILSDLNTEFSNTLRRIIKLLGTKKNWLFRKFSGLRTIMSSENQWYVTNDDTSIYINLDRGTSYYR